MSGRNGTPIKRESPNGKQEAIDRKRSLRHDDSGADKPQFLKSISLMTWCIDWQTDFYAQRVQGILNIIREKEPDIIFLQGIKKKGEEDAEAMIRHQLERDYHVQVGSNESATTKTSWLVTLIKRSVSPQTPEMAASCGLQSGQYRRTLFQMRIRIDGHNFRFINVHMDCSDQDKMLSPKKQGIRVDQIKQMMQTARDEAATGVVIFGGNLNIRDNEERPQFFPDEDDQAIIQQADAWECAEAFATGGKEEHRWTWDTRVNDIFGKKRYPKEERDGFRFDRIYSLDSHKLEVSTEWFELLGKQKLLVRRVMQHEGQDVVAIPPANATGGDGAGAGHGTDWAETFLSDHFGIFTTFRVVDKSTNKGSEPEN